VRGRKVDRSCSSEPLVVRGLAGERSSVAATTSASNSAALSRSFLVLGSSTISSKSISYAERKRVSRKGRGREVPLEQPFRRPLVFVVRLFLQWLVLRLVWVLREQGLLLLWAFRLPTQRPIHPVIGQSICSRGKWGWYRNVIFFIFAFPFSLRCDYWHCRSHFKIVVVPVGHAGEREG
jgi:hypothetical protein